MAVTTAMSIESSKTALEEYLQKYAEPNKLNNYEAYPWCTEALLADHSGLTILIPTIDDTSQVPVAGGNEGDPSVPNTAKRAMTFSNRTATLDEYTDAYAFSSMFRKSVSMRGWLERHALFLANGFARKCEDILITFLDDEGQADGGGDPFVRDDNSDNGGCYWVPPDVQPGTVSTTYGNVLDGDLLGATAFMKARSLLRTANSYGYAEAGGRFAAFVHPESIYSIQNNLTSGYPTMEADSMNLASVYKNNYLGDQWGFRFFESPYTCFALSSGELGLNSGSTGNLNFCLAPDAFYRGAFATDNFQLIFHDIGESGAYDPADEEGTLASKGYATVVSGNRATGLVKIPVPNQNG